MATTEELWASGHPQWELALLLDGISTAFVSDDDLEVLDSGDGRSFRRGLVRERLVRRIEIDPRTGHIVPKAMSFRLEDHIGDLPSLFVTDDDTVDYLTTSLLPGTSPTPANLFNKHVGHEKIGPAGERRRYPVPLGYNIGLHHHALFDDSKLPIHPPPVSDVPVLWKGRRAMLYRVMRDHIGDATLDAWLRFAPDLQTLKDGPSGVIGVADGSSWRGGPRRYRDFDGDTNRVDWGSGSMPNLVGIPFTISFWVYRRTQATDDRAVNMDLDVAGASAVFVDLRTNGSVRILWGTDAVSMERQSAASVLPLNTWTQVTVKGDGSLTAGNYEIFINGVEVSSYATTTNGTGTARATTYRWSLGGRFSADTNNVDGRLAVPRVWLRELTGNEPLTWYRTSYGFRPFTEWEPIWWGVLNDDGEVEGRVWTLSASGPESWTQKDIGQLSQTEEQGVDIDLAYTTEESWIYIKITKTVETTLGDDFGFTDFLTTGFTGTSVLDLRLELAAALSAAATAAGVDGVWTSLSGCTLHMSASTGVIQFSKGADIANRATCEIGIHRRIWGYLGFDLGELLPPQAPNWQTFQNYELSPFTSWPTKGSYSEPPHDGYARAELIAEEVDEEGIPDSSFPVLVELKPNYQGGVAALDPDIISARGQVLRVEQFGATLVAHYGQLYKPPASDPEAVSSPWPIGGPGVDRSGMWLLSGKIRYANTEEEIDEYQLVHASWQNSDGLVNNSEIVVTGLFNPKSFGFERKRLKKAWVTQPGAIKARPVIYLGWKASSSNFDEAHVVMQRLLLSTGTSTGWWINPPTNNDPGYDGENAVLDAGDNESSHNGNVRRDAEYADYGCGIPQSMLQHSSRWGAEAEAAGDAVRCRVAFAPGANSEDVIHGLMQPIGWSWSLRNGKYGIFTPFAQIEEEQVEVAITRTSVDRATAEEMIEPVQRIREFAPIDKFLVSYSRQPYLDDFMFTREHRSVDRGRRYRPGGMEETIEAPWWRDLDTTPVQRRLQEKADFWERRHFAIERIPLLPSTGRRLWPGTFVRFTHELAVDPILGTYGVAGRRGVGLAVEEDMSRNRPRFFLDFLIHADRTITPKLHSISARGYGYDDTNDRILVHDNWLGLLTDGSRVDAAFFREPAYVGLLPFGGNLRIKWYQWDGAGWEQTGTGVVTAVSTTPGSCYLEMSAGIATGTYYPCKDTIVVSVAYTAQDAAYALQLYAGIGNDAGHYTGTTPTATWEDLP